MQQSCDAIITVGFLLGDATEESAKANPDIEYVLIDDYGQRLKPDADNVKPLLYNTGRAAFLAGYAAADYTKTGMSAPTAACRFPTVTIFMDGFAQGAETTTPRTRARTSRSSAGTGKTGSFTGGFEANTRRPRPRPAA